MLATGEALPSLMDGLRARERLRTELEAERAHLQGLQRASVGLDQGALRAEIRGWCTDWHGLLDSEPVAGPPTAPEAPRRPADLDAAFDAAGGLVCDYAGEAVYRRLLAGVVRVKWMVPPG